MADEAAAPYQIITEQAHRIEELERERGEWEASYHRLDGEFRDFKEAAFARQRTFSLRATAAEARAEAAECHAAARLSTSSSSPTPTEAE